MHRATAGALLVPALVLSVAGCEPGAEADPGAAAAALPECDPDDGGLTLAEGFCALVVHEGVGPARHLTVTPAGDVFVRLRAPREGGGIVALRDTTGDGRADVVAYFQDDAGTGIRYRDGHLYYSTNTEVYRYRLPDDGALVPEDGPELIVGGFPAQRGHAAKPFTFDPAGHIYVNIGSPTNACQPLAQDRDAGVPGQRPCPEFPRQAAIWQFDADRTVQLQGDDGRPYAIGIRNAVALAWSRAADGLYIVQHGRDMLDRIAPAHYTPQENAELPSEEFHRLEPGDTLSHPYCYHDPIQDRFVLAPEYGGDGRAVGDCERFPDPLIAYPAHYAPNDLLFYEAGLFPERFRDGAFIAWHGSWNRAPLEQRGYKVTFQPMRNGQPAGDWEVFADGFAGIDPVMDPRDAEHRPMGLAVGPDGSLYISDSVRGRIWRVVPVDGR